MLAAEAPDDAFSPEVFELLDVEESAEEVLDAESADEELSLVRSLAAAAPFLADDRLSVL